MNTPSPRVNKLVENLISGDPAHETFWLNVYGADPVRGLTDENASYGPYPTYEAALAEAKDFLANRGEMEIEAGGENEIRSERFSINIDSYPLFDQCGLLSDAGGDAEQY